MEGRQKMKKLDWDSKLSNEDREWALQFDHLRSQVEENDREFGRADTSESEDRAARIDELRGLISEHTNELARLEAEQANEDNTNRAVAGDSVTGNAIRDNTGVDGETPEGAPAPAETYEGWNAERLKAEIRERNKEREEAGLAPLSVGGSKAELTERLLADDREIAESSAE